MPLRTLLIIVLTLALAAPLAAYSIYLRDGSRIIAREKYEVDGDRAIITLPNGTQTFIRLDEIDVQRTEQANRRSYGGALVLEEGRFRPIEERDEEVEERPRLSDLIAGGKAQPRLQPERRRQAEGTGPDQVQRTRAGFPDLRTITRTRFHNLEVASELQTFLRAQDAGIVEIHQGTRRGRVLVEMTTNSEAAVFRSLAVSANALVQIRDRFPEDVEALEILMMTPQRQRAGQFLITPELATALLTQRIDVPTFFVRYVQF